ncbi:sensor histidine kinase [Geomesophilobacter sediminis]|uniref:histidine kinase n=1 Tax=Geomesophilobacter sediminis TaxID=2798584 RepID=A0A8J7LYQ1_9BACT|nr:ATP-binding protein [Geomesophilobacter sediminis]MBJ6725242.1 hypothetical protein [Geomesophilobacter sediminis]
MTVKGYRVPGAGELRQIAEERLDASSSATEPARAEFDRERFLRELQVNQIELELQHAEILHARDEVEALLEKYTDLYDFAPIGYLTLNGQGIISSANLCAATLLDVERSHLLGRRFGLFVADEARSRFAAFLDDVFASQEKKYCELPLITQTNRPHFVRIEAIASESSPMCRVAVVDITELKLSEDRIIRLNNELEQRVKERTAELEFANRALNASYAVLEASYRELEVFSYAVAHDLRTPLRGMSGFSNILLEDYSARLDEPGQALLKRIGTAAGKMGQLVDGILNLSRLTRVRLTKTNVDLSLLAGEILDLLSELEPERKVDTAVAGGIIAYGDLHLLRQVLENLLQNAWKYTGKCPAARIEFGTVCTNGETVYFVRDNGIGFDMLHTARLFIPFERLHGEYEYEGIGIGLATVQRIVQKHDGRIWAEGRPDEGASFYFTLPERIGPAA